MTTRREESLSPFRVSAQLNHKLQAALAYLLLFAQPVVFFRKILIYRTGHIPFDIEGWHLPIAAFLARCAREHVWPAWNPYVGCGAPAYVDLQAQMFYPITWLALLAGNLSEGRRLFFWLQALVPLHMCLGGIFLYLFLRRLGSSTAVSLLGGTIYELSAFFASQAQHLGAVCAAAFFPLLLLCALELSQRIGARWTGITALASALCVLAGFPQSTIVAFTLAILFALALIAARMSRWRSLAALAGGMAIGVCISAVQLVPTLEAIPLTIAKLRADWHLSGGGLPVQSLVSFVWPNFYHVFSPWDPEYKLHANFTFLYTYCGHAAALLVLIAPVLLIFRKRTGKHKLIVISIIFVLISGVWMLGDTTPLYRWIYLRIPRTLRGSLYAEYALMGFCLWVAVAAALTLQEVHVKRREAINWAVALLTGLNLIAVSADRPMNTLNGGYKSANSEYTIAGERRLVETMQHLTRSANPPLRIDLLAPDYGGLGSGAQMYRIPAAVADDPFNILRYYYFRLSLTGDKFWDRIQPLSTTSSRWIDAIDVGFILAKRALAVTPDQRFDPVPVDGIQVWKNRSPLPRFYLVDRVRHASDLEAARSLLPGISDPGTEAIVEGLRDDWRGSGASNGSVRVLKYEDNDVELVVNTGQPSYLVTSEAFYPGWRAAANGRAVDLLPTNVAFRGMPVPAGETKISMNFHVDYFEQSAAVSLLSLFFAFALIALPRRTRSRLLPGSADMYSFRPQK